MRRGRTGKPWTGSAAVLASALILWSCGRGADDPGRLAGNGTVEATEVEVSARITGRLVSVGAREGERVTVGRVLATLDAGEIEGQVRQAEGNLAAARAAAAELRSGSREEELRRLAALSEAATMALRRAEARRDLVRAGPRKETLELLGAARRQANVALADAETELARIRRLVGEGALPSRDLDQAQARRDGAEAASEAAASRLAEAEAGARPEEIADAEAAVAQAAAQAAAARETLSLAVAGPKGETLAAAEARVAAAEGVLDIARSLRAQAEVASPIDGTVTLRSAEAGEVVTPGMPILRIANLSTVWLRVYVPETRLGRVRLGQAAEVTVDSFPGKVFSGTVIEIAEKPEFTPRNVQTKDERVKLVFGVKVEVANPDGELKPGMPADAVILVGAGG